MTLLEALEAGVVVGVTNSLGVRRLIECGAAREIDTSVSSIRSLLDSLLPDDAMARESETQQAAWRVTRQQYDPGTIKLEFQRIAQSVLAPRIPTKPWTRSAMGNCAVLRPALKWARKRAHSGGQRPGPCLGSPDIPRRGWSEKWGSGQPQVVRPPGFEPGTCGLRVRCSAIELEARRCSVGEPSSESGRAAPSG